jgi:hypothetical protein
MFDPVVELLPIDNPRRKVCEAVIRQPLTMIG